MTSDQKGSSTDDRVAHLLKKPIQSAVNGQLEDIMVVDLVAPSKKQLKKSYRLQQYLTQAMLSSQKLLKSLSETNADESPEQEGEAKESTFDAQAVMAIMLASDVDISACFDEFEKLAASGCVEVNGISINKVQYEKLESEDLEGVFSSYVANFTLPSVMRMFSGN